LSQRDPHWQLWVPAIGCLIALPTQLAFLLLPETLVFQLGDTTVPVALFFMMLSALFAASWVAPSYAAVQNLVPPHWRTQASALLLLTLNLLGMGLGPLAVGLLSDWFGDMGVQSIRYALAVTVSTCILGSLCYWYGSGAYASAIGADRSLKKG
jgi:MFS family permease